MAIIPETQYAGKIAPATAAYPYGQARNITLPGDGTGTPWEAALVNDIFGFQQSLLSEAAITPSGDPEEVGASQYLEALSAIFGRGVTLTTDILTKDLTRSSSVVTLGRDAIADGGGARWVFTGTTTPGSAGTEDIANRAIYDSVGNEFKYAASPINPAAFGILPSAADNAPAWQDLLTSAPGHIHFSVPGTYTFLASSDHTADISITAAAGVVIDCSDAGFVGGYWTKFSGAFPQIEDLGVDAVLGERTVTFASAPSLSPGDVFVIWNPAASSWSGFRANYYAGEFCRVVSVSGSVVTLAGELYDDYTAAAVNVYRLDGIRLALGGFELKGDVSTSLLDLEFCRDTLVNNVKGRHKNNSIVSIKRCFNTVILEPSMHNEGDGGDDYGIAVSNSQTIKVNGGDVYSRRHAITTGGDAEPGAVPCRDLRFSNLTLSNDINSGTNCADFHGNTEDSVYEDCEIYGGATWKGKNNGYVNCRIGSLLFGGCILSAEVLGGRLYAENCRFHTITDPQLTSRAVFDIGSQNTAVSGDTTEDVTFEIKGGSLNGSNFTASTTILDMRNRGSVNKVNIVFEGVDLKVNELSSVVRTQLISGTADSDFIIVDNIRYNGVKEKPLCSHNAGSYLNFPHRLQKQSGTENLSFTTAENFVTGTPVVFNWAYPRLPCVTTGRGNKLYAGASQPIESASTLTLTGLTMAFGTPDAANFGASGDVNVSWQAEIAEV